MDDRLKRHLEAAGYIDGDGIGRRVQSRFCRVCHRPTLTAADAPMAGHTVRVDPTPLDAMGELAALLAGCSTFDLSWAGERYELDFRYEWHIRGAPPGTGRSDVLAEHRCGRVNISAQTSNHVFRSSEASAPVDPPF